MRRPRLSPLHRAAAAGALLAVTRFVYLAAQVDSSRDLVLLRNAVIADFEQTGAYDWTPASVPENYLSETLPSPEPVAQFVAEAKKGVSISGDFETAVVLARALAKNRSPAVIRFRMTR